MIPKFFFCRACHFPAHSILCPPCKESLTWNPSLLPSPTHDLSGIAPLLFAFEQTQKAIRSWKENGGSRLETILFQMPPPLKEALLKLHFLAIIPIPQSQKRSYRRGQDSADCVARFFSSELDVPILRLLELHRPDPEQQTGKSRFNREISINPFQISESFPWNTQLMDRLLKQVDQGQSTHLLIVDDLITSGATLTKASARIRELIPRAKCFAGSLGYRPRVQYEMEPRWNPNPRSPSPLTSPTFRSQIPPGQFRSDAQAAQDLGSTQMNP